MIDFSTEKAWLRPFRNARKLLLGRTVQAVLSVGYLALATRALGVADFGILTLVHATIILLGKIASFQAWQMVMRYGARAMTNKNPAHLKKIIMFALRLEVIAALVGIAVVWLLSGPLASLFSIPPEYTVAFKAYAFLLVFILASHVAKGCLQLTDRHDLMAWQLAATPVFRVMGAGFLFLTGGGLVGFLVVWFFASALARLLQVFLAWRNMAGHIKALRQEAKETMPIMPPSGRFGAPEAGLWKYLWGTHANSSIGIDLAPMLVASVLGPTGAGLMRVAQKIGAIVGYPVNKLLAPVIYTDMTWLTAQGESKHRRSMIFKTGAVTGLFSLLVVALIITFGREIITFIAGAEFVGAYGAMVMVGLATVLGAFSFGLAPMLVTAGKVWRVSAIQLAALGVFVLITPPLVVWLGVTGAGVAFLIRTALYVTLLGFVSRKLLRKKPAKTPEDKA